MKKIVVALMLFALCLPVIAGQHSGGKNPTTINATGTGTANSTAIAGANAGASATAYQTQGQVQGQGQSLTSIINDRVDGGRSGGSGFFSFIVDGTRPVYDLVGRMTRRLGYGLGWLVQWAGPDPLGEALDAQALLARDEAIVGRQVLQWRCQSGYYTTSPPQAAPPAMTAPPVAPTPTVAPPPQPAATERVAARRPRRQSPPPPRPAEEIRRTTASDSITIIVPRGGWIVEESE